MRAAFAWSLERNDAVTALRLATALGSFWLVRGTISEGRTWLERALALTEAGPSALRARALSEWAWVATVQSDLDAAEQAALQAVTEAHAAQAPAMEALAINHLAHVVAIRGDMDRAAALAEDADKRFALLGTDDRSPGERTIRARIEHRRGNRDHARILFEEILAYLQTEVGDLHWIAEVHTNLGDLDCDQGDVGSGVTHYMEALAGWQGLDDVWGIADALTGFAEVAMRVGQPVRAAHLLGAADAFYAQVGIGLPPHDRINYPKTLEAIRTQLGAAAFAAAHGAGGALTLEEAVADATALADEIKTHHA
jgi:non-specific serine/threonine protein kinase